MSDEEAKALKGTRWLWVKNWENLTQTLRANVEKLRLPKLELLDEQREQQRDIRGQEHHHCCSWIKAVASLDNAGEGFGGGKHWMPSK